MSCLLPLVATKQEYTIPSHRERERERAPARLHSTLLEKGKWKGGIPQCVCIHNFVKKFAFFHIHTYLLCVKEHLSKLTGMSNDDDGKVVVTPK